MMNASYRKVVAELLAVLLTLGVVAFFGLRRPAEQVEAPLPRVIEKPAVPVPRTAERKPTPSPAPAPVLDREAVARGEEARDSARRERLRAEKRREAAKATLADAQIEVAGAKSSLEAFLAKVQDPTSRLNRAAQRGAALREEKTAIEREIASLDGSPRPGRKRLIDKSPVARPAEGDEAHFELRGNRIATIELERLFERVKADVRLQLRLALQGKAISGEVGPVGDFRIRYEMGPELPDSDFTGSRGSTSYGLRGWELIPSRERRGETYEATRHPASDYARALHRLNPSRDTVTLWVYPDSFPLYRRLRDELNAQGYMVAGRPLPEGVSIQGSPGGSRSAGQ